MKDIVLMKYQKSKFVIKINSTKTNGYERQWRKLKAISNVN